MPFATHPAIRSLRKSRLNMRGGPILLVLASLLVPAALPAQTPVLRNPSAALQQIDGAPVLQIGGKTDLPNGAVITVSVTGLWNDLGGTTTYGALPPFRVEVSDHAVPEGYPLFAAMIPGRYRLKAEVVPLTQVNPGVAVLLARRRLSEPVSFEFLPGTTGDILRLLAEDHSLLLRRLEEVEAGLAEFESFARARQRSSPVEDSLLARLNGIDTALQERVHSPRPPFLVTTSDLFDRVQSLESLLPSPLAEPEEKAPDPQEVFADDRLEKALAEIRSRLLQTRIRVGKEYANAILGEVERACRRLAEAYRTAAANPRDWAGAVREAREAADQLLAAASAPEAAALGGKGANHVALLQAFTTQIEARPPAPPPAEGEAADPKLPADVAEGLENIARALQAARSKLAS